MENEEKKKSCEELISIAKMLSDADIKKVTDIVTGMALVRQSDNEQKSLLKNGIGPGVLKVGG